MFLPPCRRPFRKHATVHFSSSSPASWTMAALVRSAVAYRHLNLPRIQPVVSLSARYLSDGERRLRNIGISAHIDRYESDNENDRKIAMDVDGNTRNNSRTMAGCSE